MSPVAMAEVPDDALAGLLASVENRFRNWTGNVDLLDMAKDLEPAAFRQYISMAREWRRRKKCKTESAKS